MNKNSKTSGKVKTIILDLEVMAHEGFFWGKAYEVNIIEVIHYGKILTFAVKPLGRKAYALGWLDCGNEERLVKKLWKVLDENDVIIGHNFKGFDNKWCKTRFLKYGLPPPSPYKIIDTLLIAKKHLQLPSYSMNNIAAYYGLGAKVGHEGWPLWKKCLNRDPKATAKMKQYNAGDVVLNEKVYNLLLPYLESEKNWVPAKVCGRCSQDKLQRRGFGWASGQRYQKLRCTNCGRTERGKVIPIS